MQFIFYRIEIITSREHAERLTDLPSNIKIVCDIPLEQMKKRLLLLAIRFKTIVETSWATSVAD